VFDVFLNPFLAKLRGDLRAKDPDLLGIMAFIFFVGIIGVLSGLAMKFIFIKEKSLQPVCQCPYAG